MRRVALALALMLAAAGARADGSASAPDDSQQTIDASRSPKAAAAELLGLSPSQVQFPDDTESLGLTLLDLQSKDLSLAFNPFKLWGAQAGFTQVAKLQGWGPVIRSSLQRSFTVSLASTGAPLNGPAPASATARAYALGLSAVIYPGSLNPAYSPALGQAFGIGGAAITLKLKRDAARQKLQDATARLAAAATATAGTAGALADLWVKRQLLQEQVASLSQDFQAAEAAYTQALKGLQSVANDTVGYRLAVAATAGSNFDSTDAQAQQNRAFGAWLTQGWVWNKASWLFVSRVLAQPSQNRTLFDYGTRWVLSDRLGELSVEWLERVSDQGGLPTERGALIVELPVTHDLYITFSAGKDFASLVDGRPNLISMAAAHFGYGQKTLLLDQIAPTQP